MTHCYFELMSTEDLIEEIMGEVDVDLTAQEYANATEGVTIDNDTPETYPDLVIEWTDEQNMPTAVIEGNPVVAQPIIGGSHPPHRPK